MKSLTTTVFLDILRRREDEIYQHLDELSLSKLLSLKTEACRVFKHRLVLLTKEINQELNENIHVWNSISQEYKILTGNASIDGNNILLCVNPENSGLICLKISPTGRFAVRENTDTPGKWSWKWWDEYNPKYLVDRFGNLPWIDLFAEYIIQVWDKISS